MGLKTEDQYIASLKSLRLRANMLGEKAENLSDHPLITPSVCAVPIGLATAMGGLGARWSRQFS